MQAADSPAAQPMAAAQPVSSQIASATPGRASVNQPVFGEELAKVLTQKVSTIEQDVPTLATAPPLPSAAARAQSQTIAVQTAAGKLASVLTATAPAGATAAAGRTPAEPPAQPITSGVATPTPTANPTLPPAPAAQPALPQAPAIQVPAAVLPLPETATSEAAATAGAVSATDSPPAAPTRGNPSRRATPTSQAPDPSQIVPIAAPTVALVQPPAVSHAPDPSIAVEPTAEPATAQRGTAEPASQDVPAAGARSPERGAKQPTADVPDSDAAPAAPITAKPPEPEPAAAVADQSSSAAPATTPVAEPLVAPPRSPSSATPSFASTPAAQSATGVSPASQIAPVLVSLGHSTDGAQQLTMRLEPPDLGQVQVRIERPADAPARVDITVERPETLTLLLRDQPQLQHALDLAGVPSEGRSVNFHVAAC